MPYAEMRLAVPSLPERLQGGGVLISGDSDALEQAWGDYVLQDHPLVAELDGEVTTRTPQIDVRDFSAPGSNHARPSFAPRDSDVHIAAVSPAVVDPDAAGRGLRSHRKLENWLAEHIRQEGYAPVDPLPTDPPFDLAWRQEGRLNVVEVKSLTSANQTSQLRTGLGQVLEYAELLGPDERVRLILFVEGEPNGRHWPAVCRSAGVDLWWPGQLMPGPAEED